ncbi:hypothetical protein KDK_70990 [Dictyobacter kobayashii]|uniref:PadR family transcriptional regulator n=1 Tax=Dictyobacter kobayashii TaxID=2014872 RepID=A0A402AW36_9CHLR|nr:hypothetical protein KDK_70990 [Dictyobacter kobayashii]
MLGILSLAPMSGYDLKKMTSYSIGHFWNESYPQIYPMLKQLESEGLTTSIVERQEGKPDRRVYTLTDTGWEALRLWLGEPFEYQVERNELLLKLFFGGLVPSTISVEHVERHRRLQLEALHHYEQVEFELQRDWPTHPQLPYWLMTLSAGKYISQAIVSWCEETLLKLEKL